MSENSEVTMPAPPSANQTTCSNCRSTMPSELRFCRNCGFRLADGMDYSGLQFTGTDDIVRTPAPAKKKRRMSGMSWIFVGLLVFFVCAAAFTALVSPVRQSMRMGVSRTAVVKSYIGVDGFKDTDHGVTFEAVNAPGGPADHACCRRDGQPVGAAWRRRR